MEKITSLEKKFDLEPLRRYASQRNMSLIYEEIYFLLEALNGLAVDFQEPIYVKLERNILKEDLSISPSLHQDKNIEYEFTGKNKRVLLGYDLGSLLITFRNEQEQDLELKVPLVDKFKYELVLSLKGD